jgi:hypothetical protein
MVKPAAGYRPLAYSSPEAVQTTGTVASLCQPLDPGPSRIEVQTRLFVFGLHVHCACAELEPALGQQIDCRDLSRDQQGMGEVVIERVGAGSKAFSSSQRCCSMPASRKKSVR